jgi:hypothetical protein
MDSSSDLVNVVTSSGYSTAGQNLVSYTIKASVCESQEWYSLLAIVRLCSLQYTSSSLKEPFMAMRTPNTLVPRCGSKRFISVLSTLRIPGAV